MAETTKPTTEQVAQGKARAGGQTSTSEQLVDKVSPEAKSASDKKKKQPTGKTGLLGVPVGTEVVTGKESSLPPSTSTGRPIEGVPVVKTVKYASGDGMRFFLNKTNEEKAAILSSLRVIPGVYPKGQAPTEQSILNALKSGPIAIRDVDAKALEEVMKYADTIGERIEIALPKLVNNPRLAQEFFAIKTTVPGKPKLTPESALNLEITQAFSDYLDMPIDKKSAKEFADTVNNLEKKRGTYLSAAERQQLLFDTVQKKASEVFKNDKQPDSLLLQRGALGGSYNLLRKAYDSYGIPIDDKAVYKQAIGSIRSRQALENALQKVSVQAQVSYPALAPYFQQGLTTKEALATYIGIKANLFGVPENSIKIDEMYPVFKGKELMTPQEWEDFLYTTPEFKKTRTYMAQRTSDAKTLIRNFIPGGIQWHA